MCVCGERFVLRTLRRRGGALPTDRAGRPAPGLHTRAHFTRRGYAHMAEPVCPIRVLYGHHRPKHWGASVRLLLPSVWPCNFILRFIR